MSKVQVSQQPKVKAKPTRTFKAKSIFSLIYVSYATKELHHDELIDLLRISRRNNESDDITGLLLYADQSFMQILEGSEEIVRSRFASIQKDPRHVDVTILVTSYQKEREFPQWSMGFRNLQTLSAEDQKAYSSYLTDSLHNPDFFENPTKAFVFLRCFRDST
jgi:hypothetical protein